MFIHSSYFYSACSSPTTTQKRSQLQHRYFVGVNTLKRYRQLLSEGLAQGPYVAARVEFEPVTFQTQTEPPHPIYHVH